MLARKSKGKVRRMDIQIITRRLTLIKYLYIQGVEQSKKAETISGFSLMHFHDAVEMFLLLVAENLGRRNFQKWDFMKYWQEIPTLTMEPQMSSMKDRRRSIKHHGAFPSHDDVDECRINVGTFLTDNTRIQFDIDFSDISLVNLVSFEKTRGYLKESQEQLKNCNYYQCLLFTRQAFIALLEEFENTKENWFHSIFNIGQEPRQTYKKTVKAIDKKEFDRNIVWFDDIDKTVKELRNVAKLIAIGVDYKRYALFNAVAPNGWRDIYGEFHVRESEEYFNRIVKANEELCNMCINFVIDCAVKFQDSDYDTSKYLVNPRELG